ncbi:GrBNV gp37-like protein [Tomelloso virus]|uniref:GrBNV gp37-like protein n=1 Tax=Tomelloso virus TaxID=2053981 RepID=A0A2H4T2N8_9VIRU|nr:GrBNV gp37-like protein [Tomelloso virus]ATY70187.1 GrBNV gp37-like protein [Tomelloso virus]
MSTEPTIVNDVPEMVNDFVFEGAIADASPEIAETPTFELSEMIEREKAKTMELLNPTPAVSRKRKVTSVPTVPLLSFINIVQDIYNEMSYDRVAKKMQCKRNIKAYVDENVDAEAKRLRNNDSIVKTDVASYPIEFKQKAYNRVVNTVIGYLESCSMQCLFPKEALKFFLATYSQFITPNDFVNTNAVVKTERRSKNTTTLGSGAILQEYTKGFDIFISSMTRSDHNDIRALKFIVENKISIPHEIYEIASVVNFTSPMYNVDQKSENRPNYTQIVMSNAKHVYLLITADILLCFDGNQFVTPPTNIEREFTMHVRKTLLKNPDEYVLLEVVFATKSRIIDILQCNVAGDREIPTKYSDRLEMIQRILPNAASMMLKPSSNSQLSGLDVSYIQKPNVGFEPCYIYHKSHLIAAAVGISEKTVALAFLEDNSSLVVKSKVSISGPITCCISSMAMSTSNEPTILVKDKEYKIVGDLNGVSLFKSAIFVELRDGNRLGSLSNLMISKSSEYKPIVVRRETSTLMKDIDMRINNGDNEFVLSVLKTISHAPFTMTDELRTVVRQLIEPNTSISFDDYNNMK